MDTGTEQTKHHVINLIFFPIVSGILTAQVIATLFVFLSNQTILETTKVIEKLGYFPIPAGQAMGSLNHIGSALGGGLFFSLSIGTGLTLVSWGGCRAWHLLLKGNRWVLLSFGVIWTGLLVWINLNGFVLFPSLFCIFVPSVTGWITIRGLKRTPPPKTGFWFSPVVALILLTAIWATQFNAHLFTSIRDHILLSNPAGRSVNDFYYKYTLFAAEAFKSFNQKTLRTCQLKEFTDEAARSRLANRLRHKDVLEVPDSIQADLIVVASNDMLLFKSHGGVSIQTTLEKVLADTNGWLLKFSNATDHFAKFRRITLFGLLIGFPILLFIMCYGFFCAVMGWMLQENRVVLAGSALCLIIGILLFLPMLQARPVDLSKDQVAEALASDQWTQRVAALRLSDSAKIDIGRYPAYEELVRSPLVVERYWLARALAKSRTAHAYNHLLTLLQDPHPNVVCQALYALGQRGQPRAIKPIKEKLKNLDHWYAQWYGYKALRRLGWHQGRSH